MPKRPTPAAIRRRRALALQMAESLEREFNLQRTAYDVDRAADSLFEHMPLTWDEALAEAEEWSRQDEEKHPRKPRGPSLVARLRQALGILDKDKLSLSAVLEAAIERIQAAKGPPCHPR